MGIPLNSRRSTGLLVASFAMLAILATTTSAAVVVEYHFDGDAMDTSGNNEHGVLMGGVGFGPGKLGQALMLDGSNDYVQVSIGDYNYSNFTLECWINVPTYGTNLHYISLYRNSYLVLGDYAGNITTTWANGLSPISIADSAPFPPTNQWQHIAFTWDGAMQRIYLNGVEVQAVASTGTVTMNPGTYNGVLNIGARHTGSTQWVTGLIDIVRLHDEALQAPDLGFFKDCVQTEIRTVDTAPTQVAPGQTGIAVTLEAENVGPNAVDVTAVGPTFEDSMANDVTSEYTITPAPGNPTSIAIGATQTFTFNVDVDAMATLGTILIDGSLDFTDQVSGTMGTDGDSDTTDTWDVIGAIAELRVVDATDTVVVQGGTGYPVSVTLENTGLNALNIGSAGFTFTGTADRTSEYTVNADPANPTSVAAGATELLSFTVDVDVAATAETITIDGTVTGTDAVSGGAVMDLAADVTDMWDTLTCGATLCGDCTGDGQVTILDALTAAQHSAALITLTGTDFTNCNVIGVVEPNPAAEITILDALTLAQFAAGLPVTLTCC